MFHGGDTGRHFVGCLSCLSCAAVSEARRRPEEGPGAIRQHDRAVRGSRGAERVAGHHEASRARGGSEETLSRNDNRRSQCIIRGGAATAPRRQRWDEAGQQSRPSPVAPPLAPAQRVDKRQTTSPTWPFFAAPSPLDTDAPCGARASLPSMRAADFSLLRSTLA